MAWVFMERVKAIPNQIIWIEPRKVLLERIHIFPEELHGRVVDIFDAPINIDHDHGGRRVIERLPLIHRDFIGFHTGT